MLYDLDPGEAAVIAIAQEMEDPLVIIDDRMGRRIAAYLGIPLRGTLGLLLDAKSKGLIEELRPILDKLDLLGFRVSRRTRANVLALAGEDGES